MRGLAGLGAAVLLATLGACSLVTHFAADRRLERTDSLCADGIDSDGNGLTDCQEFTCLGRPPCCAVPLPLVDEDFAAGRCAADSCAEAPAPDGGAGACLDAARWAAWGTPTPRVCDGALWPRKDSSGEQCHPVGVLSLTALPFRAGLDLVVGFRGQLEYRGELSVALTFDAQVPGTPADECQPLVLADPVVAFAGGAGQLVARFDGEAEGSVPFPADDEDHELRLTIDAGGVVHYALDGGEIAASPGARPVPSDAGEVFLRLGARTTRVRFTRVQATSGTRCESPGAWSRASPAPALEASVQSDAVWDSYEVGFPAVVTAAAGETWLFYTGGHLDRPEDCGLGYAVAGGDGLFARPTGAGEGTAPPLVVGAQLAPGAAAGSLDAAVLRRGDDRLLIVTAGTRLSTWRLASGSVVPEPLAAEALLPGTAGAWDDGGVCCATAVADEDGIRLWYAGWSDQDPYAVRRIGLATSRDGVTFHRHPANPVLTEGPLDEFDGRGVTDPEVVWDESRRLYRMWYGGRSLPDLTAIGYAVSADGVRWLKNPDNPVVTEAQVGLQYLGSPAVVVRGARLRMWLHGKEPGKRFAIYEVVNDGTAVAAAP